MAIYEYRCPVCETTFELRRAVGDAAFEATCPVGHAGARRVLSVFATAGRGASSEPASRGGCGGNCACAAGPR